ncbi:MAG: chemotaxis protein CheW [Myxococcota bacterium]|nr:chemotaxis protein CheW [Myxococcota bacterium]
MTEKKKTRATSTKKSATRKKKTSAKANDTADGPDRIHAFADSLTTQGVLDEETIQQELETWVTFNLAGETFSLPVTAVQEILRVETITPVPHAPYTVRGIINMRGRVVPVVDFRTRLSLPDKEIDNSSRILITSTRDHLVGLLVDSVEQVVNLDMKTVEPPPRDIMTDQSEYFTGVCRHNDKLVFLLDVDQVLLVPDSLEALNRQKAKAGSKRS